jgi:hypothetical protein
VFIKTYRKPLGDAKEMNELRDVTELDVHHELQDQIAAAAERVAKASVAVEKANWEKKRRVDEYRQWLIAADLAHRHRVRSDQKRIIREITGE